MGWKYELAWGEEECFIVVGERRDGMRGLLEFIEYMYEIVIEEI